MPRYRKVGGQISGGGTNLGGLGRAGTHTGAKVKSSKKGLGRGAALNRGLSKMASQKSGNLGRKAYS